MPKTVTEEGIRPAALMTEKQRFVEQDRDYLLAHRSEWVLVSCPGCAGGDFEPYGEKGGFVYVECTSCHTVYTNPRPSLELSHSFYAQSQNYAYWNQHVFPATEQIRRESIMRPRAQRVVKYCREFGVDRPTLLEVGAAFGTFCDEARRTGFFKRIVAVEPTPGLAATCRGRGLEVLEKPIELVQERAVADVVAAFEVLEHLFDPKTFLEQCRSLLRPGGLLVVTCPNVRGFDLLTLKTSSNTFDHEHVNYFHPESLKGLVGRCGFESLTVETPGELDAELVRKRVVEGKISLKEQPFLHQVLIEEWGRVGAAFQEFLRTQGLSSHMWAAARRLPDPEM